MKKLSNAEFEVVRFLLTNGPATSEEIAVMLDREPGLVTQSIYRANKKFDKVITCSGAKYVARTYSIAPQLAGKTVAELREMLQPAQPPRASRQRPRPEISPRAIELAKKPEHQEILLLNAPYLGIDALARCVGEDPRTVIDMAQILGLSLEQEDKEPRATSISGDLDYIPLGSTVVQWLGGTCINMPPYGPGIKGVIRHYAV